MVYDVRGNLENNTKTVITKNGVIKYEDTDEPCDLVYLIKIRPIILCIPSLGDNRHQYRLWIPWLFQSKYRVISMDLCGSSRKSKWKGSNFFDIIEDVLEVVRDLNLGPDRKIVLISNNTSNLICGILASFQPSWLEGVIFTQPVFHPDSPFLQLHHNIMKNELQILLQSIFKCKGKALKLKKGRYVRKPKDLENYSKMLKCDWNMTNNFASWSRLEREYNHLLVKGKLASFFKKVNCPILCIGGEFHSSKIGKIKDYLSSLASYFSNSLLYESNIIENCGSSPQEEQPVHLLAVVDGFIERFHNRRNKTDRWNLLSA